MVYEIELDFKISGCEDCPYHKNGQVETLGLSFCCDLSQKYMLIPNEEMNDYHNHKRPKDCPVKGDNGWHYIEDGDYPPEQGWYFCLVNTGSGTKFMANEWKDIVGYQWVYGFHGEIIAWRKAEDPIKILNEASKEE